MNSFYFSLSVSDAPNWRISDLRRNWVRLRDRVMSWELSKRRALVFIISWSLNIRKITHAVIMWTFLTLRVDCTKLRAQRLLKRASKRLVVIFFNLESTFDKTDVPVLIYDRMSETDKLSSIFIMILAIII